MIYETILNDKNEIVAIKKQNGDITLYIPVDESNSDYQRYLRWLENPEAEQFTPGVSQ